MIQLSAIKEKISWALVVSILFYVAAAVIALAMLVPTKSEKDKLLAEVERLERNETNLLRIIEERPVLENEVAELEAGTQILLAQIPSQYDLPEVLDLLRKMAASSSLKVEDLSHVPVRNVSVEGGLVPLTLEVSGRGTIFSFLAQIQNQLPSLQLTNAAVGYLGDGRFYALVRADLHVLLVDQAAKSRWRAVENIKFDQKLVTGYGLPFEIVAQFFANQVKVLGVVNMGSQGRALVAKDGSQRWVKAGDRIGEATVSKVTSKGIVLNLDGVLLDLTIGGRQDESA